MKAKWARVKSTLSSKTYAQKYGRENRLVTPGWIYPVDVMPEGQQQMLVAMGAIELLPKDYTPQPEEIAPQDTETRAALERQRKAAQPHAPAATPDQAASTISDQE